MSAQSEPAVVLASASPRRRRLLAWLGLPFSVTAVDTPESLDSALADVPAALAAHLAEEKAAAAYAEGIAGAPILTFDTIVVLDGALLGKPTDDEDAWRMLRALSGRSHQVVTGVAIACPGDDRLRTLAVTTNVRMKELSDAQIGAWMALGEYRGCAGAYNIEGQIAEVDLDECYQNVAGIPLCHLFAELKRGAAASCLAGSPVSPVLACDEALGRVCKLGPGLVGATSSSPPR
ncbi:MAG: septum formation protein Maf [Coriobacteriales bacterium]|nr:septum formation protein Maf [Coriobacteriales bacterium]